MIVRGASSASSAPTMPRSVLWRVSLGRLARTDRPAWARMVAEERGRYKRAKRVALEAPDGSLPDGFGESSEKKRENSVAPQLDVNNPLSLAQENPWHAHFDKLAALEQIQKDVQRAFPEDDDDDDHKRFSKGGDADKARFVRHVSSVLAVWSLQEANAAIGYRQGMHEVAGVCWLVVKEDAEEAQSMLRASDDEDVEADTYAVFDAIMARASSYYVWKPGADSAGVLPIHQHCDVVEASLLSNDAQLSRHLAQFGISASLFAIRWMRLLFLRELPLDGVLGLWDALFDVDPSLYLMAHVCVAMVLRIRPSLMAAQDNPTALRLLLSYPADEALRVEGGEQDVTRAESIRMLLDEARQAHRRHAAVVSGREKLDDAVATAGSMPPSLTDIARGLLGPGLHRAINNVQRTVNAAYSVHNSSGGVASDGFPPSMDALRGSTIRVSSGPSRASALQLPPPVRRPSRDDPYAQLDTLRATNKQMGATMDNVVRTLESLGDDTAHAESLASSLTALKHVRDVLCGRVSEFDAASLVVKKADSPARSAPPSPTMSRIAPAAAPTPAVIATSGYPPLQASQPSFGTRFPRTTNDEAAAPAAAASRPTTQFSTRAPLTNRLSSIVSRSTAATKVAADDPLGVGQV